jgi:hypothetical protein
MTTLNVAANFPIPILSVIGTVNAPPTYESIRKAQLQINTNAASVHTYEGGGAHGHLVLTMMPAEYLLITPIAFAAPVAPPVHPVLPVAGTVAQITAITKQHTEDKIAFHTYQDTDRAIVRQLLAATDHSYIAALSHPAIGFTNVTALQIMTHLYATYGVISLAEREANLQRMNKTWQPPSPIEALFDQLQRGVTFAAATGEPIADATVARIGYNQILRTGLFGDACREWRLRDAVNQTYAEFVTHFKRQDRDRLESTTAGMSGYAAMTCVDIQQPTEPEQQVNSATSITTDLAAILKELQLYRATAIPAQQPPPHIPSPTTTPMGYCWTHGSSKNTQHTSRTCTRKAEGHNDAATFRNKMGGSTKTWTPRR